MRFLLPHRIHVGRLAVLLMAVIGFTATLLGFMGRWHWYADLFSHFRPQYCVGLIITALAAWCTKQRVALVLSTVGAGINLLSLASHARLGEGDERPASAPDWTFLSINLLQGNRESERVISHVRSASADVVVFQEVTPRWALALEELVGVYPYRLAEPRKDHFGIALFSRRPPVEAIIRTAGERAGDLAVFAIFEVDGRRFGLAGVHPDKPDEQWKTVNRRRYLSEVARWCDEQARADRPAIVLGDFNATPWSASLGSFARESRLRATSRANVFGATWNPWMPHRLLIDNAFVSPQWIVREFRIGPAVGSDHRPILVRAAVADPNVR